MSTRSAERDILVAAERLMDGLLDAEHEAFTHLDSAIQRTADATRERIVAAHAVSPTRLWKVPLLPDDAWLVDVVGPPVADLVALARERALRVARQQMRCAAGALVGARALRVADHAVTRARDRAPSLERVIYTDAMTVLTRSGAAIRGDIATQRRTWAARHEDVAALIARCCSAERVGLPGASRGVVWGLRATMHATARQASVDTVNALLTAAMRGWNERTTG